ncbi:hypothetical protein H4582DRAFT_2129762 [Lactarius indigo]|nr:hypothetical protein H4582DRAFT_2129762 [Lactarius indigo]
MPGRDGCTGENDNTHFIPPTHSHPPRAADLCLDGRENMGDARKKDARQHYGRVWEVARVPLDHIEITTQHHLGKHRLLPTGKCGISTQSNCEYAGERWRPMSNEKLVGYGLSWRRFSESSEHAFGELDKRDGLRNRAYRRGGGLSMCEAMNRARTSDELDAPDANGFNYGEKIEKVLRIDIGWHMNVFLNVVYHSRLELK